MAWQVVFYVGAACAVLAHAARLARPVAADRWRSWPSLYLLFAAFIALSWHYNPLERLIPAWVARQIYPIDKTNIDILRFVHFLALAWLVRLAVPAERRFPADGGFRSHFAGAESSRCLYSVSVLFLRCPLRSSSATSKSSLLSQIVVSVAGIVIMCAGRLCGEPGSRAEDRRCGRRRMAEAVPEPSPLAWLAWSPLLSAGGGLRRSR